MSGKIMIRLIGMGPGNLKYLTYDAVEKISAAATLLAFGRIAEAAKEIKKPITRISKVNEIIKYIEEDTSGNIAILASGDPCFYGILDYLKKNKIVIDEVVPGISSFQYMMAKLGKSWHNAELISLHGREDELDRVLRCKTSVILTDSINTPDKISKDISNIINEVNIKSFKIYAGFNLSYDDENIIIKNIGESIPTISSLSVVVIENEMD